MNKEPELGKHRGLYDIFRMDQAEHPMDPEKAAAVWQVLSEALETAGVRAPAVAIRRIRRTGFPVRTEDDMTDRTGSCLLLRYL